MTVILHNGDPISNHVERCNTLYSELMGLRFRSTILPTQALVFDLPGGGTFGLIDTLFVFFTIGVVWVDEDDTVLRSSNVKPFRLAMNRGAHRIIEFHPRTADRIDEGDTVEVSEI